MSASLAPECNEIKERYDTCFLNWYSEKFLRGNTSDKDCEKLFEQYKKCLSKPLQDRGIAAMVEEARNSNKESDAEFLKKKASIAIS
ncbi:Mitochondrial distribution and morphology protein 35 [Onygenales sp. PD_12]|nr:Mitochondrial distribution and morphology protein 35 [Onygenales sp. PD_12]KAK2788712.1 Mitochondrial distribution and morphology protein 35 [Emmonsiellopsis sp. PD_33]